MSRRSGTDGRAEPAATPSEVWPTRVIGSQIAHLSVVAFDNYGAGYEAICTDRELRLELMPEGAVFLWCPACRSWADEAGVTLPVSR